MTQLGDYCTGVGEPPDDVRVTDLVLGKGEFRTEEFRIEGSQRDMIKAVKFTKGPTGQTTLGRWLEYYGRYVEVICKIPDGLLPPGKVHSRLIRDNLEPKRFREAVDKCVQNWLSPRDRRKRDYFEPSYRDPAKLIKTIEHVAVWMDE